MLASCIRYRRERWLTPDGRLIVAPLPGGVDTHFGPDLRRFVLAQYHQGQVTVPGLVAQLRAIGLAISTRQVMRLLIEVSSAFSMRPVTCCAPGWRRPPGSRWMTPGPATRPRTRPAHRSAMTTSPGSAPRPASRLNFLELLRAGQPDYVINAEALAYMRHGGNWRLVAEFTEIESGKQADRPALAKAFRACRLTPRKARHRQNRSALP